MFIALRDMISTLVFIDYAAFGNSSERSSNKVICLTQSSATISESPKIKMSGSGKPYLFTRSSFASSIARSTLPMSKSCSGRAYLMSSSE